MKTTTLSLKLAARMSDLYMEMTEVYDIISEKIKFTCSGCPDNCCDSYFQHHTRIEWAYLWFGLSKLSNEKLTSIKAKAIDYIDKVNRSINVGVRPQIMCPLNDRGLCSLYKYRLMICRMHGVPAKITRPDGKTIYSPGCFRCQELTAKLTETPHVDRTRLYSELVDLEIELTRKTGERRTRVKMTIAEMIMSGPPEI